MRNRCYLLNTPLLAAGLFILKYHNTMITMDNTAALKKAMLSKGKESDGLKNLETAVVNDIYSFSPFAKTRGGIKIGSSLKEVLDVFGEASPNYNYSGNEPTASFCSIIFIYKYPENNPIRFMIDNFSGYVLRIDYLSEGISFYFKIDGKSTHPKVIAICVKSKSECRNLMEKG